MPAQKMPSQRPIKPKVKPQQPGKLSKTEEDLLSHMADGYQLETTSLWENPILRNLKENTEVRATANRGTIESLQRRGLIAVAKTGGVFKPTLWRLKTAKASK